MKRYLFLGITALAVALQVSFIDSEKAIEASNHMTILSDKIDGYKDNFVSDGSLCDSDIDDDCLIIYNKSIDSNNFIVDEFIEYDQDPSEETIRKIKEVHIPELQRIRDKVDKPIIIRSAARSYQHEISQGRSGKSQHVYSRGLGAVDISLLNYNKHELDKLEKVVVENSGYKRVARYNTFIHLDYANNRFGERGYYRNTKYGWIYIGEIE